MPKMKVNDINMYYEVHGEGEPLVMIAGFGADHLTWMPALEILKNSFQVILFDNRGAGQTDAPEEPYSVAQMAEDVVMLCHGLGIKQANFVGNSMGGFILQKLARDYPGLVKSAIISNSTMTIDCVFHLYVAAQYELLKAKAPLPAIIKASCCWAFSFQFLSQPRMLDQLVELTMQNPYPFSLQGYSGQYAALDAFNSRGWASTIQVPTLVMGSDQDLIFNERDIKDLANTIPGATYSHFDQCGHLPMLEYPEKFAAVVTDFVAKIPR